jgi:hypothetical protein
MGAQVRVANSSALTWYLNYSRLLVSSAGVHALGLQFLSEMNQKNPWKKRVAANPYETYTVDANADSFALLTTTWPASGTILTSLIKFHTHMGRLQALYLLRGTPSDLGLDETRFYAPNVCTPAATRATGLADNNELLDHIRSHCPSCLEMATTEADDSRLLCQIDGAVELDEQETFWDRKGVQTCSAERLHVESGEAFTILTLFGMTEAGHHTYSGMANAYDEHSALRFFYVPDPGALPENALARTDFIVAPLVHAPFSGNISSDGVCDLVSMTWNHNNAGGGGVSGCYMPTDPTALPSYITHDLTWMFGWL